MCRSSVLEIFQARCNCTGPVTSSTTAVNTTLSPLSIYSTWISSKYVKVWPRLALRRGKMVFPSLNMMTVHSLIRSSGYVGMGSMAERGIEPCRRWPPIKRNKHQTFFLIFHALRCQHNMHRIKCQNDATLHVNDLCMCEWKFDYLLSINNSNLIWE